MCKATNSICINRFPADSMVRIMIAHADYLKATVYIVPCTYSFCGVFLCHNSTI